MATPRVTSRCRFQAPPSSSPSARSCLIALAALTWASAPVRASEPGKASAGHPLWDAAPFEADPAAALAWSRSSPFPAGQDVEFLLMEMDLDLQPDGRAVGTTRLMYRLLTPAGVRSLSIAEATWSPAADDRPEMRARVIAADGTVSVLDPGLVSESAEPQRGPLLEEDHRRLSALLPGTGVGAIVEHQVTWRERVAPAGRLRSFRWPLAYESPTRRIVVSVSAPASLPLRHVVRGIDDRPMVTRDHELQRISVERRLAPARPEADRWTPPDDSEAPYFAISTARSWKDVAATYGRIVEAQLSGEQLTPVLEEALGTRRVPSDAVSKVTAFVRRKLRYTPAAFESSILPVRPNEAVRRGFGDAKDMSTLLVALLRTAGIPADVALVRLGDRRDIDLEAPELDGFTHAIVHVGGREPLWIDPTARYAAAGELPTALQGRYALVARADTEKPVLLPAARPEDNELVVTRELDLTVIGRPRAVRTVSARGAFAYDYREALWDTPLDSPGKLKDMAAHSLRAEQVVSITRSDPALLEPSFRVRAEVDGTRLGSSIETEAEATLPMGELLERVREIAPLSTGSDSPPPRARPLLLPTAHTVELRYVVKAPDGLVPTDLPADETLRWGPATLSSTYRPKGATAEVTFRFSTGPRRYSAEDVGAFLVGLAAWEKQQVPRVQFSSVCDPRADAAHVRSGLERLQALSREHPTSALHHLQLADALLALGFGGLAREQVRRAVELEPESPRPYIWGCWVLQHDELGRMHKPGFDRGGAIDACRKAIKLGAKQADLRGRLATLLRLDDDGIRLGKNSGNAEALDLYADLRREAGDTIYDDTHVVALVAAGKLAEARALAGALPRSPRNDALLLAAIATSAGAPEAVAEAHRRITGAADARTALEAAAETLVVVRIYGPAAQLLTAAARDNPDGPRLRLRASMVARMQPRTPPEPKRDDPDGLVLGVVVSVLAGPSAAIEFARTHGTPEMQEELGTDHDVLLGVRRGNMRRLGFEYPAAADFVLGESRLARESDGAGGYHVTVDFGPNVSWSGVGFFLVRRGERLVVLGTHRNRRAAAREALRLIEQGKRAAARRWLEWAVAGLRTTTDPTDGAPEPKLLQLLSGDDERLERIVASTILVEETMTDESVRMLAAAAAGEQRPEVRFQADRALLKAYSQKGDLARLEEVAARVENRIPIVVERKRISALVTTRQPEEASHRARRALEKWPGSELGLVSGVPGWALACQGDAVGARQAYLAAAEKAGDEDRADLLNDAAWYELFAPVSLQAAEQHATEAARLGSFENAYHLHTLASVYAALDRPSDAWNVLMKVLDEHPTRALAPEDWYVVGRVAEAYGLAEAARDAYGKVASEDRCALSTARLAQDGLRRLARSGTSAAASSARRP